jgi:hypothetical protein
MSLDAHLAQLERKHKALQSQIESEMAFVSVDEIKVAALKRKKLKIKDEITRIKAAERPPRMH